MLDFSRLRSQVDGQRGAFEGLIRHLAQVNPPAGATTFQHIHGAGGDGGIEAYWLKSDRSEYGYQAKFHTKSGDVDWSALDRSIMTAMKSHGKLTHIQVALACDLTDVVPGRKGTSGHERWNTHFSNWSAAAKAIGRTMTFALWGASDIEQLLTRPEARGLREYWFGDVALDAPWFKTQFTRTLAALEERYSPDDHVDVTMQHLFDGLQRSAKWREELRTRLEVLFSARSRDSQKDASESLQALFQSVTEGINALNAHAKDIELGSGSPFPTGDWLKLCKDLREATHRYHKALMNAYKGKNSKNDPEHDRDAEWKIREAAHALESYLREPTHEADAKRFVIFEGRAGAGKSHLLAAEVARSLNAGQPAVMLLGTDFSGSLSIDLQITALLGLNVSFDTFLGALAAAAELASTRALIVIDAINEGGGAAGWRDQLAAISTRVVAHQRLALVVSCRSEYAQYLLTSATRSRAVVAEVQGFVTAREQEKAAQMYMDKRGILRPATPWLSPEFTNPLFLRTTCLALERDGRNHYPVGLRGVRETLAFYLDATGRHLGTVHDGSNDLVSPLKQAVVSLAEAMAISQADFVPRTEASRIVNNMFDGFAAGDRSWLDRLRLGGIVRIDPHPDDTDDPLQPPPDVVRFAFQRFQDHLVAERLLAKTIPSAAAFEEKGALHFFIGKNSLAYQWAGVFQALWSLTAEKEGKELVDLLPGGADRWWRKYQISEAFVESVYWRDLRAFTERSLELLNALGSDNTNTFDILLQLSVLDHPWNAELLDINLQSMKLPDRDAFWTVVLNRLVGDDDQPSSPERLVNWCLGPGITRATDKTLAHALVTLGWIFTTTNRQLRDRATKAATEILLLRADLLPSFVSRFVGVDDLYVVERVMAACAGACFRDPAPRRLRTASRSIYDLVFAAAKPPRHLLGRDYARGIVELANDCGVLPGDIDIMRCRPPYRTPLPRFPKDDRGINERAKKTGADSIISSCIGPFGDFGRYVIESRMSDWSNVRLTQAAPTKPLSGGFRYDRENKISIKGAQRWVANQAIRLGWNKKRFPRDSSFGDSHSSGGRIERIGKKYQWLAYFELLARLADNYWLLDSYNETYSRSFDTPLDTEFVRDIDPTVPTPRGENDYGTAPVFDVPSLLIETVASEEQKLWVFASCLAENRLRLGLSDDIASQDEWVSLYRYASATVKWPEQKFISSRPTRQDDFHFVMMIALPKKDQDELVRRSRENKVDFHRWLPADYTDAGYLYELGRRGTWPNDRLRQREHWPHEEFIFTGLTLGYHWESHLDGSLPEGASFQLPAPWLLKALDLEADPQRPGQFLDSQGIPTVVAGRSHHKVWCVARRRPLLSLLAQDGLAPLWAGIGERSGYPHPEREAMVRIRWNGLMWLTEEEPRFDTWDERYDIK
ncbi:hypothetical protein [Mesorhizobium sp. M0898]|uniref:hypothetical protein n=1 Tax=Mesorhizobium sp. M0898 TaxID=2957020 RepID=UPI003339D3BD